MTWITSLVFLTLNWIGNESLTKDRYNERNIIVCPGDNRMYFDIILMQCHRCALSKLVAYQLRFRLLVRLISWFNYFQILYSHKTDFHENEELKDLYFIVEVPGLILFIDWNGIETLTGSKIPRYTGFVCLQYLERNILFFLF